MSHTFSKYMQDLKSPKKTLMPGLTHRMMANIQNLRFTNPHGENDNSDDDSSNVSSATLIFGSWYVDKDDSLLLSDELAMFRNYFSEYFQIAENKAVERAIEKGYKLVTFEPQFVEDYVNEQVDLIRQIISGQGVYRDKLKHSAVNDDVDQNCVMFNHVVVLRVYPTTPKKLSMVVYHEASYWERDSAAPHALCPMDKLEKFILDSGMMTDLPNHKK